MIIWKECDEVCVYVYAESMHDHQNKQRQIHNTSYCKLFLNPQKFFFVSKLRTCMELRSWHNWRHGWWASSLRPGSEFFAYIIKHLRYSCCTELEIVLIFQSLETAIEYDAQLAYRNVRLWSRRLSCFCSEDHVMLQLTLYVLHYCRFCAWILNL